jgi:predicted porin
VTLRGDVGGFGISNSSSDLSWQVVALIGYDFTRHFLLYAGYRALALDESNGGGSSKKGADLVLNGALIGLDFHW